MRRLNVLFFLFFSVSISTFAIAPFYSLGSVGTDLDVASEKVKSALQSKGFDIIGEYAPGENSNWYVLVYSSKELKNLAFGLEERTGLAAALKFGFIKKNGQWQLSAQNPAYLFNAVFMGEMDNGMINAAAKSIETKAKSVFSMVSAKQEAFGGDVSESKLRKYHYMLGMPYFTDPVELKEFSNFEEGVNTIRNNLKARKGNTLSVYEIVDASKKIAVFGVALNDTETGEAAFLPTIGEDHLAAMPYEIILEGKEATCLHGRYRFALNWPELTMGTFTKIMSTPGDVSNTLEALTE